MPIAGGCIYFFVYGMMGTSRGKADSSPHTSMYKILIEG